MYSLCIRNIHDKPYGFCGCKAICLLYLLMQYTKRYMTAIQTDSRTKHFTDRPTAFCLTLKKEVGNVHSLESIICVYDYDLPSHC